jgi:hypothetical protein
MRFSELVAFRNQLDSLSTTVVKGQVDQDLNRVHHLMQHCPENLCELRQQLEQQQNTIQQQLDVFDSLLEQAKQQVKLDITEQEKPWFTESYRLYEQEMPNESTEYILNRRQQLTDETQQVLLRRLENYTDWRVPGLIVRPGHESFVQGMVANDPLYLVDQNYDLLVPTLNRFPEAYQRRLRTYVINERGTDPLLQKIPDGQIGLCLVYNFFNFKPFEVIKQWLLELKVKLRPGGVLIMTINDCDQEKAVMLVENYYACYTPGHLILDMVKSMGFEIISTWNDDGPSTWIELRKPGELTSLRGGQTLAKILSKDVANSK